MKKRLYLMRHGETLFNVQHKIQGWCDSPLTQNGIEQAHGAGRLLAERGIKPDLFACSTSERASDTLEVVMEELGHAGEDYLRLKGIKEFNHGVFEGEHQYLQPGLESFESFFIQFGGENSVIVSKRMGEALDGLMARDDVQTVLAVSHAGAMFTFFMATGADAKILNPMPNCTCIVFDYDDEASDDPVRRFSYQEVVRPLVDGAPAKPAGDSSIGF